MAKRKIRATQARSAGDCSLGRMPWPSQVELHRSYRRRSRNFVSLCTSVYMRTAPGAKTHAKMREVATTNLEACGTEKPRTSSTHI